jgi:hypothetical protein
MGWLGGNYEMVVPTVRYVVKICHKGLLFGSYSAYQKELSDKVLDLRDRGKLSFKSIAEKLIAQGYRSPRGFDLGPESIFSIYKKRKVRDERLYSAPAISIFAVEIEHLK